MERGLDLKVRRKQSPSGGYKEGLQKIHKISVKKEKEDLHVLIFTGVQQL